MARGKSAALRHLRLCLHVYFRALIEPHLQVLDDGLRTECAGGIQRYLQTGPEGAAVMARAGHDLAAAGPDS